MRTISPDSPVQEQDGKPWYRHPWPWLLMAGPAAVIVAGAHTAWLAFSHQDALVVGDYYKEGKAINQDLRRDRAAAAMGLVFNLQFDPAAGKLTGTIAGDGQVPQGPLRLRMVHSTQPEKDLDLLVQADAAGAFSLSLPMLEQARWQIVVENAARDWRLAGEWSWPGQRSVVLKSAGQIDNKR